MSVSKRLRFEILRRDNHACRYCGQTAPDVRLTIDHVKPKALGGSDDPGNLVTACASCNGGKTSLVPGSDVVADVAADALRWSRAVATAAAERRVKQQDLNTFVEAWETWKAPDGHLVPIAADWRNTGEMWLKRGCLDIDEIIDLIPAAMSREGIRLDNRWRYFCGVVWRTFDAIEKRALELVEADDEPPVMWIVASDGGIEPLWGPR